MIPALILGGGPAGASAAIVFAQARAPHLLVERAATPGDALCGGFLSWRTLATLEQLGVVGETLNRDVVSEVRLFAGDQSARAALPQPGRGVSRRQLDTLLMRRARTLGAAIETGTAREYAEDAVRFADGSEIPSGSLFLATGKHDLRGLARPAEARGTDPALGLRVRLEPAARRLVGPAIELHLFDRGYAGLVAQEDGTVNLCLAVHRSRLAEAGNPERLLLALAAESPRLGERLSYRTAGAIDAVANVPYGWRATRGVPGLFRMGDQAGVIPSLAGEGIGIAVASGLRAARAYLDGGDAAAVDYQRALAASLRRPLAIAGLIRSAAERPRLSGLALSLLRPTLLDLLARLTRINHTPVDADPAAADI